MYLECDMVERAKATLKLDLHKKLEMGMLPQEMVSNFPYWLLRANML